MKKITLLFIMAICFGFASFGQTKTKEVKVKYRVVVSFASQGSGIDAKKFEAITDFVNKHPKKPVYEVVMRGREGEREYCFHLKEIKKKEQKEFIEELRKLAQGSDIVSVTENAERVKKQ